MSPSVSKELDSYGFKFKMNFVIHTAPQIQVLSKNKNNTGHMQIPNRILMILTMYIVFCISILFIRIVTFQRFNEIGHCRIKGYGNACLACIDHDLPT